MEMWLQLILFLNNREKTISHIYVIDWLNVT
jgi:hypothetical protein